MAFGRKTLLAWSWLALLAVFVQAYLSLSPALQAAKPDRLDLSGGWELCQPAVPSTQGCAWSTVSAPDALSAEQRAALPGWLIYRRRFTAPQACLAPAAACAFLIGEVGDAAEARLNGVVIGRHGDFPPRARYAKHYPALFKLSRDRLEKGTEDNELQLTVYALKRNQSGLVRGPLGIFSNTRGFSLTKSLITLNVILPILGCVALFLMGAIPALTGMFPRERDGRFYSFVGYCFANSLFLLSFSEVPRESLPIGVSGYLHFLSRILSDWAYFNMVQKHYEFPDKLTRRARLGYRGVVVAFGLMFLYESLHAGRREAAFDTAFLIMRAAFPLLLLPHALGLIGALRSRHTLVGQTFTALFGLTLLMQVHDCLIFHGFISGAYAVKIYPVFIGAAFGWLTLQRYHRERERLLVAEGIAGVLTQVAHDIRAPLDVLDCVARDAHGLPAEDRNMLQASIARIRRIAYDVIRSYREAAQEGASSRKKLEPTSAQRVSELILSILAEKRIQYRGRSGVKFDLRCDSAATEARVRLNPGEFERAISNLIDNGVEAAGEQGLIGVSIHLARERVLVTIRDTGKGIPSEMLRAIGQRGTTYDKKNGCGLGIHHAKACAEAWGGSFRIHTMPGQGTAVTLALPLAQGTAPPIKAITGDKLCEQNPA